jgi:hypothetical protein
LPLELLALAVELFLLLMKCALNPLEIRRESFACVCVSRNRYE